MLSHSFKSGKVAKDILLQALEKVTDKMKMEETLNFLNSELKKYHDLHGKENEYFSAQIIMYNDYYKEIWNFGDCNCSINGKFHNHDKLYDRITSNARALYNSILLKNGYDTNQLLANDLGSNYIVQGLSADDVMVTVNIKGVSSVIQPITAEDIVAYLDLSGYGEGEHEVDVNVEGTDVKVQYQSKTKKVKIRIVKK